MSMFEKLGFKKEKPKSEEEKKDRKTTSQAEKISRRKFLKTMGGALAALALEKHGEQTARAGVEDLMTTPPLDEELEKKEEEIDPETIKFAAKLPSKIIEEKDFPLDKEKFSQYLNIINKISREQTGEWKKDGSGKEGGYDLVSIYIGHFEEVFFSEPFQKILKNRAGTMSYMNAFSLAQATYRTIEKKGHINQQAIQETAEKILENIDQVRERELFGPDTKLVLFTHEEAQFNNEAIVKGMHTLFGGKPEHILSNEKGASKGSELSARLLIDDWHKQHPDVPNKKNYLQKLLQAEKTTNLAKIKTLYAIACSQGPTTVLFSGHGSETNWSFSENQSDNLDRNQEAHSQSINYKELGDALIQSKNIKDINLIGASCFSYDYLQNLFTYLEQNGIKDKPYVSISESNIARFGWTNKSWEGIQDYLLREMYAVALLEGSKTIKVDHFFKAEGGLWRVEDPAIMIGPQGDNHSNVQPDLPDRKISSQAPVEGYLELGSVKDRIKENYLA